MNTRGKHLILGIVFAALPLAALRDLNRLGPALPWRTMDEFADFYCAGAALDDRASPYTYEPLHACEHRVNVGESFRAQLFQTNPGVAVPAPQPAYDFLPFMALARLNPALARTIDAVAIVLAIVLCALVLAQLGIPLIVAAAALLLSGWYAQLATAQIIPFGLLALVVAGWSLARGRYALAGLAAALVAIEPSVGAPAFLATILFVPRARLAAIASAVALLLLMILLVGARGAAAYVGAVLPAHSLSELRFPFQYSLTYLLAFFGAAPDVARIAGSASYMAMLLLGLYLAPRVSQRLQRPEMIVFLPVLCVLVGGPFLHQEELSFALPAVMVMAVATQGTARIVAAAALCALAIPWIAVWGIKQLFLAALLVWGAILVRLQIQRTAAVAIFVTLAALTYAFELRPPRLPVPQTPVREVYASSELVQREWRDYTERRSSSDPLWIAIKIPAWTALMLAICLSARSRAAFAATRES